MSEERSKGLDRKAVVREVGKDNVRPWSGLGYKDRIS